MANFEDKLASLEAVVERLERGELSLDESVKLFEEGMRLSGACRQELEAAEGKIQQLVEQGERSSKGHVGKQMVAIALEVDTSLVDEGDEDE